MSLSTPQATFKFGEGNYDASVPCHPKLGCQRSPLDCPVPEQCVLDTWGSEKHADLYGARNRHILEERETMSISELVMKHQMSKRSIWRALKSAKEAS